MGQKFESLSATHQNFIKNQKIFFVGTATATSKVNISPKGIDTLRILDQNRVIWLNVTGRGNEIAAHVLKWLKTCSLALQLFANFANADIVNFVKHTYFAGLTRVAW